MEIDGRRLPYERKRQETDFPWLERRVIIWWMNSNIPGVGGSVYPPPRKSSASSFIDHSFAKTFLVFCSDVYTNTT